ncbi:hypothetical protein [Paraglaciecola sp. 2405UD69-4]|uniref:hypothetical protein n=1 Tax=Paraglaciecola sp. 2405UD69-4 TaxID=3391836 RepID=UPI0039C9BE92
MSTIGMNKAENLFNWEAFASIPDNKFVYINWIKNTCDKLINMVDPDQEIIFPINFFKKPNSPQNRIKIHQFVKQNRSVYRDKLEQVLDSNIKGIVFTFDWYFMFRDIVDLANKKGILTILIPHEGVFSSEDRYYLDREYGYDIPICKHCLLWGELQKRVFIGRGHSGAGFVIVGAPKIEALTFTTMKTVKTATTFLLVLQNMDCQSDIKKAVKFQNSIIEFMCEYAVNMHKRLVIRNPPNNVDLIPSSIVAKYKLLNDLVLFNNTDDPLDAINDSEVVLSINSTMLLEAKLMGKRAISIASEFVETLWEAYGVETVFTFKQLEKSIASSNGLSDSELSISHRLITDFGLSFPSPSHSIKKYLFGYMNDLYRNNNH